MKQEERLKLIDVFNDTEEWYKHDETLKAAIAHSIEGTKFYSEIDYPPLPERQFEQTRVEVNRWRSFEAAWRARNENPSARIGVLNFASATMPGGGVKIGSGAQEECLCRCSILYPVLTTSENQKNFYRMHRVRRDPLHTDACIYSPEILVIKSDIAKPARLEQKYWLTVDVLTCAAPKLNVTELEDEKLFDIHVRRGRHLLTVAAHHGLDVMILGAFGCGAFKNEPKVVAAAYKELMSEFDGFFDRIIFAVFCPTAYGRNFVVFKKIFNE